MTGKPSRRTGASRRRLLIGGLGLAGTYAGLRIGVPALTERLRDLEFETLARPAGFRRLISTGSSSSTRFDPLIGLDPVVERAAPSCAGLFDGAGAHDLVPVGYFSDYNCPYCRVLGPRIESLDGVAVTWHELPLLGAESVVMARAALAARAQGAYRPFHDAMMRTPRPSPAAILKIAAELDLDAGRLRIDMNGPAVEAALSRSDALAALFGLYGTPALVVGRTLVIGAIGQHTLDRLVVLESADLPVPDCT